MLLAAVAGARACQRTPSRKQPLPLAFEPPEPPDAPTCRVTAGSNACRCIVHALPAYSMLPTGVMCGGQLLPL